MQKFLILNNVINQFLLHVHDWVKFIIKCARNSALPLPDRQLENAIKKKISKPIIKQKGTQKILQKPNNNKNKHS